MGVGRIYEIPESEGKEFITITQWIVLDLHILISSLGPQVSEDQHTRTQVDSGRTVGIIVGGGLKTQENQIFVMSSKKVYHFIPERGKFSLFCLRISMPTLCSSKRHYLPRLQANLFFAMWGGTSFQGCSCYKLKR